MRQRRAEWGELSGLVCEPDEPDKVDGIVMLCHGYGAPGTDLVGLAGYFDAALPELSRRTAFVFPAAPVDLSEYGLFGGRAWWLLNMQRLQEKVAASRFEDLVDEQPPGLIDASAVLTITIDKCLAEYGLAHDRLILGGFSQGAMISTQTALSLKSPPAGLALFSGMLINAAEWDQKLDRPDKFPVCQSHGVSDPILPISTARMLQQRFDAKGWQVDYTEFRGSHEIPAVALKRCGEFLERQLPPRAATT